jgi:hypothetical protein
LLSSKAGHTKLNPTPGKDQSIVVGCGGPSGTGKRPIGEPILPAPVFIQDNPVPSAASTPKPISLNRGSSITAGELKDDDGKFTGEKNFRESEVMSTSTRNSTVLPEILLPKIENQLIQEVKIVSTEVESELVVGSNTWNGVTWNAVFPVPRSSLNSPVWLAISRVSHSNLLVNPFGQFRLPVSDILDLTLPPVDGNTNSPWPRPQSYYLNLMDNVDISNLQVLEKSVVRASAGAIQAPSSDVGSKPSINALRQIFPGVNMSYAAGSSNNRTI